MKNILFYSPDLSMCASWVMLLYDRYAVTTTTKFENIKNILLSNDFDMVVFDAEPNIRLEELINEFDSAERRVSVILTYVFTNDVKMIENKIRSKVEAIFYKPIDLSEVTKKIDFLLSEPV